MSSSGQYKLLTTVALLFSLAVFSFGKYHQGFLQDVPDLVCSILTSDEAPHKSHATDVSLGNRVSDTICFVKDPAVRKVPTIANKNRILSFSMLRLSGGKTC